MLVLVALLASRLALAASPVCLDPGHPSEVHDGGEPLHGTTERRVAWEVAGRLARELSARGVGIVLTKQAEDERVTNRARAEIANRAGAALFVRLHCDAGPRGFFSFLRSGFALYYPDRAGERDGVVGPAVEIQAASREAAFTLHEALGNALRHELTSRGVRPDSHTRIGSVQGVLTGSLFSHVPVVTVELGVLTNPDDAELLRSARGQELVTAGLTRGIVDFVRRWPGGAPPSSPPAVP